LDVGSNIGYYAMLESNLVGKKGKVIAIEPSPINFSYLKKNIEQNNLSNVQLYNLAAGNFNGKVKFLLSNFSNWSRVEEFEGNLEGEEHLKSKHEIDLKTIDSVLNEIEISSVNLIRMDVEGFEYNVYQGLKNTIKKFSPLLVIEFHVERLGIDIINFLLNLKEDEYKIKYFIRRYHDQPLIADKSFIRKLTVDDLIEQLNGDDFPGAFTLFLSKNN